MVWLVQNCRSNKCLIPKTLRASRGLRTPGPAVDLKRSPDPSPSHFPLTTNPRSAPDTTFSIDETLKELFDPGIVNNPEHHSSKNMAIQRLHKKRQ